MFSHFKTPKVYTDEELFSDLKRSNIQVNEDIIEKARSDDGNSLFAIGDLYYNQKTMISFWKAMAWYRRSAKMDNSDAQNMIGYFYQHGLGIPVNYSQAKEWYQNAANQGNMKAQNNLGFIFDEGLGVSIDSTQALYWYQKAAAQGYSFAQYNLGMMFESGQRVETNKRIALEWYKKSAINGDLDAADKVEELEYQFYLEGLVTENKEKEDTLLSSKLLMTPSFVNTTSLSVN